METPHEVNMIYSILETQLSLFLWGARTSDETSGCSWPRKINGNTRCLINHIDATGSLDWATGDLSQFMGVFGYPPLRVPPPLSIQKPFCDQSSIEWQGIRFKIFYSVFCHVILYVHILKPVDWKEQLICISITVCDHNSCVIWQGDCYWWRLPAKPWQGIVPPNLGNLVLTELRILQFTGLSFKTLHAHKRAANTHGQFRNCLYLNFVAAERIYHDISTSSSKQRTPTNARSRFIFQHSQKHAFTKPILEIGMGVPPPLPRNSACPEMYAPQAVYRNGRKLAFCNLFWGVGIGVPPPPFPRNSACPEMYAHTPFTGMVGNLLSATYFGRSG